MTDPDPSPKLLHFRFCLDMERWPTPNLCTENFKFQIWPGHGKMTNPPTLTEILNFRFGLDMVRWLNPQPSPKILNFRFGPGYRKMTNHLCRKFLNLDLPGHGKMTDPHPHWAWTWKDWPPSFKFQIWSGHAKITNPPTLLQKMFKFQIWPGHGKMTGPLTLTKNFKFQIWPGHGKMTDPHPHQTI